MVSLKKHMTQDHRAHIEKDQKVFDHTDHIEVNQTESLSEPK